METRSMTDGVGEVSHPIRNAAIGPVVGHKRTHITKTMVSMSGVVRNHRPKNHHDLHVMLSRGPGLDGQEADVIHHRIEFRSRHGDGRSVSSVR